MRKEKTKEEIALIHQNIDLEEHILIPVEKIRKIYKDNQIYKYENFDKEEKFTHYAYLNKILKEFRFEATPKKTISKTKQELKHISIIRLKRRYRMRRLNSNIEVFLYRLSLTQQERDISLITYGVML